MRRGFIRQHDRRGFVGQDEGDASFLSMTEVALLVRMKGCFVPQHDRRGFVGQDEEMLRSSA